MNATHTVVRESLLTAVLLGERLCGESPALEGDDWRREALLVGRLHLGDAARAVVAVALFRGLSPVAGWECERELLGALGDASGALPATVGQPLLAAAARRIWRLRGDAGTRANGWRTRCPYLDAWLRGVAPHVQPDALSCHRKRLDRELAAVPARVALGAAIARRVPLTALIVVSRGGPGALRAVAAHLADREVGLTAPALRRLVARSARGPASR